MVATESHPIFNIKIGQFIIYRSADEDDKNPWTAESVRIQKGKARIHGRPNRSEFKKGKQGSMDGRISPNFKKRGFKDPRTAKSVQILKGLGAEIHGRQKRYELLKPAAGTHGRLIRVQSKAADVGSKRPMFGRKWPMSKRPMLSQSGRCWGQSGRCLG